MLAEIKARLSLPTPAFWQKLQRRTGAASAAFAALTITVASLSHLPALLATGLGYAAAFFGGISAICSLAVDNPVPLAAVTGPAPATDLPPASA